MKDLIPPTRAGQKFVRQRVFPAPDSKSHALPRVRREWASAMFRATELRKNPEKESRVGRLPGPEFCWVPAILDRVNNEHLDPCRFVPLLDLGKRWVVFFPRPNWNRTRAAVRPLSGRRQSRRLMERRCATTAKPKRHENERRDWFFFFLKRPLGGLGPGLSGLIGNEVE